MFMGLTLLVLLLAYPFSQLHAFDCETLAQAFAQRLDILENEGVGPCNNPENTEPCRLELNNALYHAYIEHLLLSDAAADQCDLEDPFVIILNGLDDLNHERVDVEGFSTALVQGEGAFWHLWSMDAMVGRDVDFMQRWIEQFGNIPSFVIIDTLTPNVSQGNTNTATLWLTLMEHSDGMYAEQFASKWIYQLFHDKPDDVLVLFSQFEDHQQQIQDSFCYFLLPEENAALQEVYTQYPDSAEAQAILLWLECTE
ncbi:MAG: hypothetical protein D6E12_11730 [Desulfovibrio sp.]|nr:MAG: hypothetical protein D6E12_11730 [Desulfovibrio sp.]